MRSDALATRLGLNVPYGWFGAASLLKGFEAAGFESAQLPAPPSDVLTSPADCARHAAAARAALDTCGLGAIVHGPTELQVGERSTDRVFEGLLSYAAELGAGHVVYHALNLPDSPASQDALLAEARSLAMLAARAERLGVTIAIENLAPVYPGPERLSHTPLTLRTLVRKIGSERLGICLDVGHANIVADLRHSELADLIRPALDSVVLFHLHDNLGARQAGQASAGLDPLLLDLHLPPGRGSLPWTRVGGLLREHHAPLVLEIHPPHRPPEARLHETALGLLTAPEVPVGPVAA
jgi:sugar phosphate isomerase/epimerase